MSRGVVLWPDAATTATVVELWASLEAAGIPTLRSHTHRRHRPHVSLFVAEHLPPEETLAAVHPVPARPIPLRVDALGLFPQGVLFLACVPDGRLLGEQARVAGAVGPLATGPWPYFGPGGWTPHVTLATALDLARTAEARALVSRVLPLRGVLDRGGVEDGGTGERWTGGPRRPVSPTVR